ncbi:MAG: thioredoxin family protein [Bacteroidaceae bacterium]|nr:thioredoxin family protein [Bacteroidaceae bacterium]
MKKITLTLTALIAAVAMMAQGMTFEPEGTTLEQASAKAKAENKLIFLDCFTSWCGPCKKMARDVFPQEQVGAFMNPRYVNLKIDMESAYGAPLAKKLQIQAYPTFVIFNANAEEIGRFVGGCAAEDFIKNVEEKSKDNSSAELQKRWQNGDRDPEFLKTYLATLNASYKGNEANDVAEAILDPQVETFASDSTLSMIFMRNITNPFSKAFTYTAKHPETLKATLGDMPVDMKIRNVLNNFPRQVINEHDGTADLDQAQFDRFVALLKELKLTDADHYRLSTLITLSNKQKDFASYVKYIKEYLKNKNLDADDMQLARWAQPFSNPTDQSPQKAEMKKILQKRLDDIRSGKRQSMKTVGNMRLSRPTDDLLQTIINAMDGKMPNQG